MQIEITASKIVFGGDAIGVLDGKTCFIEGALPSERVLVKVLQDKKNFLKTKAIQILEASPHRVTPPCAYVTHCGGCQYQHVTYEKELEYKHSQVVEMFESGLGVPPSKISPVAHTALDYGYRNSATLHATKKASKDPQKLGFIGRDNVSVIPIKDCLLVNPALKSIFEDKFRLSGGKDSRSFKLSQDGDIISDDKENFFRIKVGGQSLLTHSQGFFQNNLAVTDLIVGKINEWAKQSSLEKFFDLYAGVGTFSFLCASGFKQVTAFEESGASVAALRMNKEDKAVSHLEIVAGRVERTFSAYFEAGKCNDAFILMDPPRQGLDAALCKLLADRKNVSQLVYLSCDPATLIRDLKIILSRGAYEIKEVVPFDMFPRTKHIEVLVRLA